MLIFEAVEGRKNSSPERFERTLHRLILHSEGSWTLICVFPFYFKSQTSNFSKTLKYLAHSAPWSPLFFQHCDWVVIEGVSGGGRAWTIVCGQAGFLTLLPSGATRASRSPPFRLHSPKIRKKFRLFCRLASPEILYQHFLKVSHLKYQVILGPVVLLTAMEYWWCLRRIVL